MLNPNYPHYVIGDITGLYITEFHGKFFSYTKGVIEACKYVRLTGKPVYLWDTNTSYKADDTPVLEIALKNCAELLRSVVPLTAWDSIQLYVNQGMRDGCVLAVLDETALVEYEMPNGTTALQKIGVHDPDGTYGKTISYRNLPKKWLIAIIEQSGSWIGDSQAGKIDTPKQELERRFKVVLE